MQRPVTAASSTLSSTGPSSPKPVNKKAIPLNVLMVEDSPNDAMLLAFELKKSGFEPNWQRVDTEVEFRRLLGSGLQMIFSDFNLPCFSTQEALRILQESKL